jgi:hypothetical protein
MINALFDLSCSYSNRVVIHQPMAQTFGLSLIWTTGQSSQNCYPDARFPFIWLLQSQFLVIISFVQRRQVFLTTNESLVSSWSCLSIDTLSFYSTMQSLDLLTLLFLSVVIFQRQGVSSTDNGASWWYRKKDKDGVHALNRVLDCIPLFRELIFFSGWRGGGNLRQWDFNMKSSLVCFGTIMGSKRQWFPLNDSL